ncbi:AMP-dependent synthetase/ligase [Cryptosporangium minutisporangium]|uniref:AMP-dependent synthetase/ligase n=1 Tax=Cryptosporangium minutisporangium TaxID=113569 RepID=UPI0031F0ECF0
MAPTEERARLTDLRAKAPASLGALFLDRVEQTPEGEAYRRPDGAGGWRSQTWAETGRAVSELAAGLLDLGLRPEDRVALMSATRVEWIEADLAVACAGGTTTTVYPTSTPEDVAHILTDSGARFAVVETIAHLALVLESPLERVVLIDGEPPRDEPRVVTLEDLRARGRDVLAERPQIVLDATAAVGSGQLATLIYTSGTTGRPKGVRLTHESWVYEGLAIQAMGLMKTDDLAYLWLPLAHAFGKTLLGGQLAVGHAAAVAGDVTKIIDNLPTVRPTVMPAVPRIFEKVYAGVNAMMREQGGAKARLFDWAVDVGRQVSRAKRRGDRPGPLLALQHAVADRLVSAKVRQRFGGRMRYFISGAAPLSGDIAEWFDAVGLLVLEGYGLTETSAASFVNRPDHVEFGTVGLPLPGTEVALDGDGEILVRGPGVMEGYHGLPDATADTLTGGWLRTGDIGEVTARGSLKITDRKKDLIKTSGGKFVAPQTIEVQFKALCPLASEIVVHGEGRNYVSALVALEPDAAAAWAATHGLAGASLADIARSEALHTEIAGYVEQLNAGLGKWETIKKFTVLERPLTVEEGDLTPSLKLKRRVVERRHADLLDAHYTS